MRKIIGAVILILCFGGAASAQSSQVKIALGGTYANGTITITPVLPAEQAHAIKTAYLDTGGSALLQTLTPGITYQVVTCTSTGALCLAATVNPNGGTQDITATLQANPFAGSATGTVTASGSPVAGNIAKFTAATNIAPASSSDILTACTGCAPLASPALSGVPTAPTAAPATNTTQLATTAFVLANGGGVPSGSAGGDLSGTYPNPTIAANAVTFAKQATQAANTVTGNYTSGTAVPTAGAAPSGGTSGCSGSTDAVIYTTNTGWGCHQIAGGSAQWSFLSSGNTTGGLFTTGSTFVMLSGFQQGTAVGSGNGVVDGGGTPGAGTVAGVFFAIRTAPGGATTLTLTVNKNGTPTTMTCVITSAITSCSDVTHTFTVNDTDRITYTILSNGTPAGADVWNIRLKMTP